MEPRLQTRYPSSWRNLRRRRQPPVIGFSIRRLRHLQFSTTLATRPSLDERITAALTAAKHPLSFAELRARCRTRTAALYDRLAVLAAAGHIAKAADGYHLTAR